MQTTLTFLIFLPLIIIAFLFTTGCVPSLETSQRAAPHFRQVRWNNTKDWVRMQERDERIHAEAPNGLVYNIRYKGIPMKLIYGFGEANGFYRLRSAGYRTPSGASIDNPAKVFYQGLLEKRGEPTHTLKNGGMLWVGHETVVYTNIYHLGGGRPVSLDRTTLNSMLGIPRSGYTGRSYYLTVGYMERGFYDATLEMLNKESLEHAKFSVRKSLTEYKTPSDDSSLSEQEEKLFLEMFRGVFRQDFKNGSQ